jgi:hypothetical protein
MWQPPSQLQSRRRLFMASGVRCYGCANDRVPRESMRLPTLALAPPDRLETDHDQQYYYLCSYSYSSYYYSYMRTSPPSRPTSYTLYRALLYCAPRHCPRACTVP